MIVMRVRITVMMIRINETIKFNETIKLNLVPFYKKITQTFYSLNVIIIIHSNCMVVTLQHLLCKFPGYRDARTMRFSTHQNGNLLTFLSMFMFGNGQKNVSWDEVIGKGWGAFW